MFMQKTKLESLFVPKSIAIIGASNKEGKVGTVITQNIRELGYRGKVFLVNQSYETLYEQKCYANVDDVEDDIDLAIISVPAKFVVDMIAQSAKKIKNFVIISAGFAEIGKEGEERERELLEIAQKNGLTILGPNCLGFISPAIKLNASFASGMPRSGNIAFVSQSGAIAVSLMDIAKQKNLAFSSIISVGNKMQLDETELLEYFEKDSKTKVIAMYLEGIKNGQAFIEMALRVSKKKPIVILKAGKSSKAQEAISSHTGALAGSDAITDSAFEKAGILRANDLEHFFDLISLLSMNEAPKNNKVAVITNAGGVGVLATDAFEKKEIQLCEFSEKQSQLLASKLPEESSVHNPIDLLGDAKEDRYENILKILEKDDSIGTILSILTPQDQTPVNEIAQVVIKFGKKSKKIMLSSFVGGEKVADAILGLRENGIVNFDFPERAVNCLDAYYKWKKQSSKKDIASEKRKNNVTRMNFVSGVIANAKKEKRSALFFDEASDVMSMYGVPAVLSHAILPKQKIPQKIQYPAVLKVDSDKVLHKSDKQALIVGIQDRKELELAIKKLRKNFPKERFVLQPLQSKQIEIILGIKRDEIFGPVVMYGLGGIYAEIFNKINFIIPPMSQDEIKNSLENGQLGFLFTKTRGQEAYDTEAMVKIISGLIAFAQENPQVKEFDINPLFIYNDKRRASAVDIKIII
ncbi:MAG: hypothetical protein ACD_8C00038G0009 [uncultured bacterium]|nr:MAG: hypothetical protein ACD_8C00038G0009 [uncultured bacterium]